ncbi:MAG: hypothetical protein TEF_02705 [Rhizobiales bacterium NRL2]|nr:MAG: hypothetical protein TEF_02705 [Rhizobiales bacterium NRL2]
MERTPDIRGTDGMAACLQGWVETHLGADKVAANVTRMPGHSGLLYGFDVLAGAETAERLVIRVPPPGVRQKNNQDVLRQVPVLRLLEQHGVPAPRARYWGGETVWFSVPYLMMSRLAGRPPGDVFDPANGAVPDAAAAERLFGQAVGALQRMHRIDAASALADWEPPRLIRDEIDHWIPILEKTSDPDWIAQGKRARDALHANAPADPEPGLLHGDYYSNNWLFHEGRLTGIVDWESVSLGPRLLDLGWLCMMYDPECWGPARRAHMHWCPPPAFFLERYAAAGGLIADIDWYRAQAGYRLGCLTAYYYELHRKGRRHDPAWEVLAESFERLMRRAVALGG